jgi:NAD(P)H-nitrite reductase large subunit
MKKKTIICRCEDITEEDVINAIEEGYTDIEELRKKLRIGMGPCQGRVCIQLIMKILEKKTGKKVSKTSLPTSRPPIVPVSLGTLASGKNEKKG